MALEGVEQGDRIPIDGIDIRRARTLDEQVFVRLPELSRRFTQLVWRLPVGSARRRRLMARVSEGAAAAANRRDFDVLLLGFDPEIDYAVVSAGPSGSIAPDLAGNHRGHTGYRHVWRTWLEAVPDLTLHPEGLIDFGDRLLAATRLRGQGAISGAPFDQLQFQLFIVRAGLVVEQRDFASLDAALEAVNR